MKRSPTLSILPLLLCYLNLNISHASDTIGSQLQAEVVTSISKNQQHFELISSLKESLDKKAEVVRSHFSEPNIETRLKWLNELAIWDELESISQISYIIKAFQNYNDIKFKNILEWLHEERIIDQYLNYELCTYQLSLILEILGNYNNAKLKTTLTWLREAKGTSKCDTPNELIALLDTLKDYNPKWLRDSITWGKETDVWNKAKNKLDIDIILTTLSRFNIKEIRLAYSWLHKKAIFTKCVQIHEVVSMISTYHFYDSCYYSIFTMVMRREKLFDDSLLESLLKKYAFTVAAAKSLLKQSGGLPADRECFPLYISCLGTKFESAEIKRFIEEKIADDTTREEIIGEITHIIGEDDPLTQSYIQLALGYDNQNDPNSFLTIHQEMLAKQKEKVIHNETQSTAGFKLNHALIQEQRLETLIHMPVNIWEDLFNILEKEFATEKKQKYQEILGISNIENLLTLKTNPTLTSLLDPKDSIAARNPISSHSQMLRAVLKDIQNQQDVNPFLQLLVNITTCSTGKLNGITHSYMLLNHRCVLDESMLREVSFKIQMREFFKEELRCLREFTLSSILINGLGADEADPHDLYFLRGIIGNEIGLLFKNEVLKIDINANRVSHNLRRKSKQELLDLFYYYYKIENITNRIHTILNNPSIQAMSCKRLTVRVVNEYLRELAFDEETNTYITDYVIITNEGEPKGLTLKAAEHLLESMGFILREQ